MPMHQDSNYYQMYEQHLYVRYIFHSKYITLADARKHKQVLLQTNNTLKASDIIIKRVPAGMLAHNLNPPPLPSCEICGKRDSQRTLIQGHYICRDCSARREKAMARLKLVLDNPES